MAPKIEEIDNDAGSEDDMHELEEDTAGSAPGVRLSPSLYEYVK
jgi:hypothetical protein